MNEGPGSSEQKLVQTKVAERFVVMIKWQRRMFN